ncbi:P63C domain-containing protein [Deinococcus frigens]|uniref:P63C domain-containing protein n=1 Tax=Deinococcus frigens TaxID=249403 RepID=UPI00138DD847|nr:P63C domain-containing protein [Deinococcus frigens]
MTKEIAGLNARKGGEARAEKLSPMERKAIAQKAAFARWEKKKAEQEPPAATHMGMLNIGPLELPCAVLEDGQRVISERGLLGALGVQVGGALSAARKDEEGNQSLPLYIGYKNLRPFVSDELAGLLSAPIPYSHTVISNEMGGKLTYRANGVKAELFPQICEVWLKARDAGVLRSAQMRVAASADILMRGLAQVGIVALIDEATGYQQDRARDALAKILEEFIAKELQPYVRTFPGSYYRELFRLRNLPFDGTLKGPRYIGTLTNEIIYKRLAPGVLEELKRVNPSVNGRRKHKQFQYLTQNPGYPKLMQHISAVVALMTVSNSYEQFIEMLDRALPKQEFYPLFDEYRDHFKTVAVE